MVADWLEMLRAEDPDHDLNTSEQGNWATAARLGIKGFDAADPAASYSQVFARTYRGRGGEGFDYLESEVAGRVPSFGYSVLAQILADTRHKTVVTTNFDDLVAEALGTYTTATPVICGHESLAGFIRHHPVRPQIVKVRQHLFYAPNSTAKKLKTLPPGFASALRKLFREHVPVVIGYGGNDGRLMKVLTDEHLDLPQSMYWCYLRSAGRPRQDILDLVARCGGWLVPIDGFDELMIELQDTLELGILDEFLSTRGNERAARYTAQRAAIILARSMRGDAGLRHDESAPLEATRTEGIEATATKAPARQAAKPPARKATKPPARQATKPPARQAAKPPARQAAKPPAPTAAKPPAPTAAKPPARQATKPPARQATKPPAPKPPAPQRSHPHRRQRSHPHRRQRSHPHGRQRSHPHRRQRSHPHRGQQGIPFSANGALVNSRTRAHTTAVGQPGTKRDR